MQHNGIDGFHVGCPDGLRAALVVGQRLVHYLRTRLGCKENISRYYHSVRYLERATVSNTWTLRDPSITRYLAEAQAEPGVAEVERRIVKFASVEESISLLNTGKVGLVREGALTCTVLQDETVSLRRHQHRVTLCRLYNLKEEAACLLQGLPMLPSREKCGT